MKFDGATFIQTILQWCALIVALIFPFWVLAVLRELDWKIRFFVILAATVIIWETMNK